MDDKSLLSVVLDTSHDGISILDKEGKVLFVNKALSKFINLDSSELIGQRFEDLISKHVFSKRSISLKALKEKRKITALLEIKGKKLLTTATPYVNDQNEVEFVVSNVRDLGELDSVVQMLRHGNEKGDFSQINGHLRKTILKDKIREIGFPDFDFRSDVMCEILETALKIAPTDIPVLITGESGVGKGVLAKIIHKASFRSTLSMIEVSCSNFPEGLIDSELFGYLGGTFTGARKQGKLGLIEAAQNSTLFLDEIGNMPLDFQTRLLKFLDDGYILRLGSTERKWVNARVISATGSDLREKVAEGKFRKDLFYRLTLMPIAIPPLRERKEDIEALAEFFLEHYRHKYQKNVIIEKDAMEQLLDYAYPGNVRELKNIVERLMVLAEDKAIGLECFPPNMIRMDAPPEKQRHSSTGKSLSKMVSNYESEIIMNLYNIYKSTYKVANTLGVSQATVSRKIKRCVNGEPRK